MDTCFLAPASPRVFASASGLCRAKIAASRFTLRENPRSGILDTAAMIADIVVRQHAKHIGHLMRWGVSLTESAAMLNALSQDF
jgi:hypothetical protein